MPALRSRLRAARGTVRPECFDATITRWQDVDRPRLQADLNRLRHIDLAALDDAGLADHLDACLSLLRGAMHLHFQLIPAYAVPVYELVRFCRTSLDWSEPAALALLAGTSASSSAPNAALRELAARIRDRGPAAVRAVADASTDGADVGAALARCDPALGMAYHDWCDRYAFRCVRNDPASPTLLERPSLIAQWLQTALGAVSAERSDGDDPAGTSADEARHQALARAITALAGRSTRLRHRFDRLLDAAERSYPLREDSAFWTASVPAALIRVVALAAGARLVSHGRLDRAEDVTTLPVDLLRRALREPGRDDLRAHAAQARAEQAWTRAHPGPPFYGPPPARPPDVRGLPGPARRLNAALLWVQREPTPTGAGPAAAGGGSPVGGLTGVAGSPGRYTGPVRVIRSDADFGRLNAGDVLVCPTTDPAWSVLFGVAGALITDGGGLLSHAAIVAREHAVPAVLGTGTATTDLHDGEVVTVDGTAGHVSFDIPDAGPRRAANHPAGPTGRNEEDR